jgi:hypothetical protein
MRAPEVTICVPAYQAAPFVENALLSCQRQTSADVRVLISVDKGDDDTGEVCEAFAAQDARFEVHRQPERIGWVANINYLLDRVDSEFFFVLFHDDFLDPTYTETLVGQLKSAPDAVICCSDLQFFGTRQSRLSFHELLGTRYDRISKFVADRFFAPMRAVTRSSVLRSGIRLREYEYESYKTGGVYMLELLNLGECNRIPRPLYSKAARANSVTAGWGTWPVEKKLAAECAYTLNAMSCVESLELTRAERGAVAAILVGQLMIRFEQAQLGGSGLPAGPARHILAAGHLVSQALHGSGMGADGYAALADSPYFEEVCDKLG